MSDSVSDHESDRMRIVGEIRRLYRDMPGLTAKRQRRLLDALSGVDPHNVSDVGDRTLGRVLADLQALWEDDHHE